MTTNIHHNHHDSTVESCPYTEPSARPPLQLDKHRWLHEDGRNLILTWFKQAWDKRHDEAATFESFIFAWISVNAWAACVTGEDQDGRYMRRLKEDSGLQDRFQKLVAENHSFRQDTESLVLLLPIFKAQKLRRNDIRPPEGMSRHELVQYYLGKGLSAYEPECAEWHQSRGECIPNDWPHILSAIYRIRCNLFHGEKSAHSEMDQHIVRTAFLVLIGFFRGANLL